MPCPLQLVSFCSFTLYYFLALKSLGLYSFFAQFLAHVKYFHYLCTRNRNANEQVIENIEVRDDLLVGICCYRGSLSRSALYQPIFAGT